MEANKILNADILDILFEGKNKSYGAYELRKTYNSRILKAILAMGIVLLVIGIAFAVSKVVGNTKEVIAVTETEMAEVKKDEPPPPPPPVTPPPPPPPPEIKQIQFTPPVVKKDEEVKKDEKIEEIKEDAAISTKTVETENTVQKIEVAPEETKGSVAVEAPVAKPVEEDKVFTKVEIEAEYPGGQGAWANYLRKNLNANAPIDAGAPPNTYTVIIKFIVAKDGSISEVTPETSLGYGMEEEAIKIIKKGPKWTPAQQNGNVVKAYRRQPITFVVAEGE
jgi:periplasmic protein TonB